MAWIVQDVQESNLVTWPPQRKQLFKEAQLRDWCVLLETDKEHVLALILVICLAFQPGKCPC